ncbi:MAG: hypothetical protein VB957_12665 [Pseudomonadales bacterium]
MKVYPIWPHQLVFTFPYGRWCTFVLLFGSLSLLFYFAGAQGDDGEELALVFFCFVISYFIPVSHFVNMQTLTAFDNLRPSLNLQESELARIRDSLVGMTKEAQLKNLSAGLLLGFIHNYFLLSTEGDFFDVLTQVDILNGTVLLVTIMVWCLITIVISSLTGNAEVFARLAREAVNIDLMNLSELKAFSRVAGYSTLVLMGVLAAFPILLTRDSSNYITILPGLFATLLPMVFIFLVPLLPIRKRISEHKSHELQLIQARISQLTQGHPNPPEDVEALSTLQPLFEYRKEIRQVQEWPFDSTAAFRLTFYLFIPPLTWVGAALIERLVDTVSF